jgi:DNA-binding IscR family transcriptional regulator
VPSHRFFRAIQLLVLLERLRGERVSSFWLAAHLGERPEYVRRLLLILKRAGLVSCRSGPEGGARIELRADRLALDTLYRLVAPARPFGVDPSGRRAADHLGRHVAAALGPVLAEAGRALEAVLARCSLEDVAVEAGRLDRLRAPGPADLRVPRRRGSSRRGAARPA